MRTILIAAAVALVAAGSAVAQTKGYAPYSQEAGDPSHIQTGRTATMPGPAARPGAETARLGPYRGHRSYRAHRMMRHRGHAVRACMRRANARHLKGRARTHYIQRCEVRR